MTCDRIQREEIIEKYLTGRLGAAEQEAFEEHYFACSQCFEELRHYRALQAGLRESGPEIRAETSTRSGAWGWAWPAAAAAAVLVVVVGIGIWRRQASVPVQPSPPVSTAQPAPSTPVASLEELARIEPPRYVPVVLRGASDEATQRFRQAMTHYQQGDYRKALAGLQSAAQLDPGAVNINFYLAICQLLTGETENAIAGLQRTAALGDSPYLEEARFYLAKALLRKGEVDAAQQELRKTIELRGEWEARARELLQKVERLGGERR